MRELRSVVHALFAFALFLFCYAALVPGHAHGSARCPRFLRMQVDDLRHHRDGPEKVSVSIPYAFVGGVLKVASLGRLHRELDLHFDEQIESEAVRGVWEELEKSPEGTRVERKQDGETVTFRKEGAFVVLEVSRRLAGVEVGEGLLTIRFPARLLKAVASKDRGLDVDALLSELTAADRGDLIDLQSRDAHVRVWIE